MKSLLRTTDLNHIPDKLYSDLHYGWGNEGWSASNDFLRACLLNALESEGDILECGSGLSTVFLAFIAHRLGKSLVSLEHNPNWARRISSILKDYHLSSVRLRVVSLRNYGDFDWYDFPADIQPSSFGLVICDGPPGSTRGGRFGLMPVAQKSLTAHAKVLLDDIARLEERQVAERWVTEFGMRLTATSSEKPFGVLTRMALPEANL